jgi:hypothetical protein
VPDAEAERVGPELQQAMEQANGTLSKRTQSTAHLPAANLAYTVNSRETLSLAASGSSTTSSGTTSDFLSASISYGYLLTREWNAQLSYRYLHRLATSGTASSGLVIDPVTGILVPTASGLGAASSNSIMLVVSRSVTFGKDSSDRNYVEAACSMRPAVSWSNRIRGRRWSQGSPKPSSVWLSPRPCAIKWGKPVTIGFAMLIAISLFAFKPGISIPGSLFGALAYSCSFGEGAG